MALLLQSCGGAIAWSGKDEMGNLAVRLGLVCQLIITVLFSRIARRDIWTILKDRATKWDTDGCGLFFAGKRPFFQSRKYSTNHDSSCGRNVVYLHTHITPNLLSRIKIAGWAKLLSTGRHVDADCSHSVDSFPFQTRVARLLSCNALAIVYRKEIT